MVANGSCGPTSTKSPCMNSTTPSRSRRVASWAAAARYGGDASTAITRSAPRSSSSKLNPPTPEPTSSTTHPDRTGAHEQVAKQTGGRPRPFLAIARQIALRDLLVEMRASDVPVSRAACTHVVTVTVNAACGRRRSRRRRRILRRPLLGGPSETIETVRLRPRAGTRTGKRGKLCRRQSAGNSTGPEINVPSNGFSRAPRRRRCRRRGSRRRA